MLFASCFIRRKSNWYAFGSWKGQLYIDNSRYLFEYIKAAEPNSHFIWIGNIDVKKKLQDVSNVEVLEINSFASMIALLKCKYMFCSQMHIDDLCKYNVYRGAIITYLHHGMPVKKWGADSVTGHSYFESKNIIVETIRRIIASKIEYDYFPVSSLKQEITNKTSLDYRGYSDYKAIRSGTPRNDMLVNRNSEIIDFYKKEYASRLDFDINKKIILYLPTFRRKGTETKTFLNLDDGLKEILIKHDAIVIEKNHFVEDSVLSMPRKNRNEYVIHVDQEVNVQELLLITDVLISDYSGAFLDFVLLNRSIIHYAYDYDEYRLRDSGLYYDINEFAAGPIVRTDEDLYDSLDRCLSNPSLYEERRSLIRNSFMEYEKGCASKLIYERVIRNDIQ